MNFNSANESTIFGLFFIFNIKIFFKFYWPKILYLANELKIFVKHFYLPKNILLTNELTIFFHNLVYLVFFFLFKKSFHLFICQLKYIWRMN